MKDWSYFDKFHDVIEKYMPWQGEGETVASQIVTAVNKLVYKWYNDGDVFDNTHGMKGWCNDISSYANWLYFHATAEVRRILLSVYDCECDGDYEDLLAELADSLLNESVLEACTALKQGSIYKCDGPFEFRQDEEDEEE